MPEISNIFQNSRYASQVVNVTDFDTLQEAFDAGRSVRFPDNASYTITSAINIGSSFIDIDLNGSTIINTAGSDFFNFNGASTLNDITLRNGRLLSTAAAGSDVAFTFIDVNRVSVENIFVQDIDNLAVFGDQTNGKASLVTLENVHGWTNSTTPVGLIFRHCTTIRLKGVNVSVKTGVVATAGAAVRLDRQGVGTGPIDTIVFSAGCQFQEWFRGVDLTGFTAGNAQNIWLNDTIFDGIIQDGLLLNPTSPAFISRMFMNGTWVTAESGRGLHITGTGSVRDFIIDDMYMLQVGLSAIDVGANGSFIKITNSKFRQLNDNGGALDGVIIRGEDCEVSHCEIGQSANTAAVPFEPVNALRVVGDLTSYRLMDNQLQGSSSGLLLPTHSAGSKTRLAQNNNGAPETVSVTVPATTVDYTNITAFTLEIHTIGGTVTDIAKNGVSVGTGSPTIIKPGETLAWTYSAAPTAQAFVL